MRKDLIHIGNKQIKMPMNNLNKKFYVYVYIQWTIHICRFHICGINQPQIKNVQKRIKNNSTTVKHKTNLKIQYNNYLHIMYIVLALSVI